VTASHLGSRTHEVRGIEQWTELGSSTFVPLQCRAAVGSFRGVLTSNVLGNVQLHQVRASAHEVTRTPKMIARNDPGGFKLGLQTRGIGRLAQDGRLATLGPGDLVVYDTSRTYSLSMSGETTETAVLMFSTEALGVPASQVARLTATRLRGDEGLAALVSPFLGRLADTAGNFDPLVTTQLAHTVLDLVGTLVRQRLQLGLGEPETVHRTRLTVVKAWIESHLGEPELTPEVVAAAQHFSVRYLYRLFEGEGTSVARWIKSRRLTHCRRDLANPAHAAVSVSAIAARYGMLDPAGFSRAFRAAYGESPRDFRARQSPSVR
jgi:AraC-like DNA-binding protein